MVTLVLRLDLEVTEHQDLEICNSPTLKKKKHKKTSQNSGEVIKGTLPDSDDNSFVH